MMGTHSHFQAKPSDRSVQGGQHLGHLETEAHTGSSREARVPLELGIADAQQVHPTGIRGLSFRWAGDGLGCGTTQTVTWVRQAPGQPGNCAAQGMEPQASHVLGKRTTTELQALPAIDF